MNQRTTIKRSLHRQKTIKTKKPTNSDTISNINTKLIHPNTINNIQSNKQRNKQITTKTAKQINHNKQSTKPTNAKKQYKYHTQQDNTKTATTQTI